MSPERTSPCRSTGEAHDLDALDSGQVDDVRIARILDPEGLAGREQQPDGQIKRLLAAHGHQDLLGMGDDATLCEHALNELLDQHLVIDGRVVGGPVPDLDDVDRIAHALAPARDGEERWIDETADERIPIAHETVRRLDDAREVEGALPEECPVVDLVPQGREISGDVGLERMSRVGEHVPVDEEAGALPGLHESVLLQPLVGERDRRHAHAELRRELPDGGKGVVERVLPVDDADRDRALTRGSCERSRPRRSFRR